MDYMGDHIRDNTMCTVHTSLRAVLPCQQHNTHAHTQQHRTSRCGGRLGVRGAPVEQQRALSQSADAADSITSTHSMICGADARKPESARSKPRESRMKPGRPSART